MLAADRRTYITALRKGSASRSASPDDRDRKKRSKRKHRKHDDGSDSDGDDNGDDRKHKKKKHKKHSKHRKSESHERDDAARSKEPRKETEEEYDARLEREEKEREREEHLEDKVCTVPSMFVHNLEDACAEESRRRASLPSQPAHDTTRTTRRPGRRTLESLQEHVPSSRRTEGTDCHSVSLSPTARELDAGIPAARRGSRACI